MRSPRSWRVVRRPGDAEPRLVALVWSLSQVLLLAMAVSSASASGPVGKIVTWGRNDEGQCTLPTPNSGFVAVAGGSFHSLGLKADSAIVAWGYNALGQCNVPTPNSGFVAVAAGSYHSLGLKANGSVVAWGWDELGQCLVPGPNSGFLAVAGGATHSLGLRANGSIDAWGYNEYGQRNVPGPNSDFVAIAAGCNHSLGLKASGAIVAWGYNAYGQCNVPAPNSDFIAVAAGCDNSLGLKADGSIVVWGDNNYGQCNVPAPNSGFVAVAGGGSQCLGLKADGSIVAWGNNSSGECSVPAPNSDFVAVAGGGSHSLGLQHLTTLRVPADAPTIQAGINFAVAGDTVLVTCGTYHERNVLLKTGVTVRSETGRPDCATVDGDALGRVFYGGGTSNARLEGFTVTNGRARWGGGMLIINNYSSLQMKDCVFHGNTVYDPRYSQGGGIDIENDYPGGRPDPILTNVTVANNTGAKGGGISIFYAAPVLEKCLIAFNNGTGVSAYGSNPVFIGSDIYGNANGDWVGDFAGQLGLNGNISADPVFCPSGWGRFTLDTCSPCLPEHSPCGELIGAVGQGCDLTAVPEPLPRSFALAQNEPNPFVTVTGIRFALPRTAHVRLAVYDLAGRTVAVLREGELPAGTHTAEWRGRDAAGRRVAAGVYFYRLEAGGYRAVRRLVFVR